MAPRLRRLVLRDFRSFAQADFRFDADWCGIIGPNGAGKTNLLEAVHVLCRLRGFRGETPARLRRWGGEGTRIEAFFPEIGFEHRLLEWSSGRLRKLQDGDEVESARDWAAALPIFGYRPDDDFFFHDEPQQRRRYLDWLAAYLDPAYMAAAARYERSLRQRNATLRGRIHEAELSAWEAILAESGAALVAARQVVSEALSATYADLAADMALPGLGLHYRCAGSDDPAEAAAHLREQRQQDARLGWTSFGPHRDDLVVRMADRPIRDSGSQGQRKLAVILLALACTLVVRQRENATAPASLFYLDDVEGELDGRNEAALYELLRTQKLQLLLTGVRKPGILESDERVEWISLPDAVSA